MAAHRDRQTIADVGEFGFLRRLLPKLPSGPGVALGPGDDCAILRRSRHALLVTTDALVENVHFRREWMTPEEIGRKAYLVNASDIAAMGGRPRFCVVSVGVPAGYPSRHLARMHRGIAAAARATGALVVGGNLTRAAQLFVSITLLGEAPERPALRAGARPGDALFVTGALGGAALGLRRLRDNPRANDASTRRFRTPTPRLQAGAALAHARIPSAMIDISDGLLQDLGHLCAAGNLGAEILVVQVPCAAGVRRADVTLALSGGEDYELLFSVRPRHLDRLTRLVPRLGCRVTAIGRVCRARSGLRVLDRHGRSLSLASAGFDHFAEGARS